MSNKIVLNKCYNGKFNLSHEAIVLYAKLSNIQLYIWISKFGYYYSSDEKGKNQKFTTYQLKQIKRTDKALIQIVEELGMKATDCWSNCRLVIEERELGKVWWIEKINGIEEIKYL